MEEQFVNPFENDSTIPDEVQEKLAKVIERYQQLNDEEKEEFQKGAFDVLTKNLQKSRNTILHMWLASYQSFFLFIFAVSIVTFLLVIVARRLYWRTKEREQRQEEKRKLRQQKAEMKKKKKKQT
ncbi:PREDICTED: uncharacterized protein LOC105616986 [Atta cephalotes]|uniref:Uncharacterized protein n=2 Tax=Atta TaxID=12956 RepID=A0A158N8U9_ATTCE|nr:PREDICTED: uncharacterized protein LOC105616986 [Atta cephalotes]XP_018053151.1 PREDICTED: uncharacterized protein LOC108690400 [Atta colombica]KYM79188.1 hypothetical protein ALC53_10352 [Atta colombica]